MSSSKRYGGPSAAEKEQTLNTVMDMMDSKLDRDTVKAVLSNHGWKVDGAIDVLCRLSEQKQTSQTSTKAACKSSNSTLCDIALEMDLKSPAQNIGGRISPRIFTSATESGRLSPCNTAKLTRSKTLPDEIQDEILTDRQRSRSDRYSSGYSSAGHGDVDTTRNGAKSPTSRRQEQKSSAGSSMKSRSLDEFSNSLSNLMKNFSRMDSLFGSEEVADKEEISANCCVEENIQAAKLNANKNIETYDIHPTQSVIHTPSATSRVSNQDRTASRSDSAKTMDYTKPSNYGAPHNCDNNTSTNSAANNSSKYSYSWSGNKYDPSQSKSDVPRKNEHPSQDYHYDVPISSPNSCTYPGSGRTYSYNSSPNRYSWDTSCDKSSKQYEDTTTPLTTKPPKSRPNKKQPESFEDRKCQNKRLWREQNLDIPEDDALNKANNYRKSNFRHATGSYTFEDVQKKENVGTKVQESGVIGVKYDTCKGDLLMDRNYAKHRTAHSIDFDDNNEVKAQTYRTQTTRFRNLSKLGKSMDSSDLYTNPERSEDLDPHDPSPPLRYGTTCDEPDTNPSDTFKAALSRMRFSSSSTDSQELDAMRNDTSETTIMGQTMQDLTDSSTLSADAPVFVPRWQSKSFEYSSGQSQKQQYSTPQSQKDTDPCFITPVMNMTSPQLSQPPKYNSLDSNYLRQNADYNQSSSSRNTHQPDYHARYPSDSPSRSKPVLFSDVLEQSLKKGTPPSQNKRPRNRTRSPAVRTNKDVMQEVMSSRKLVLVILRGCPGSGKTTLAREIQYNGLILSSDDFFQRGNVYDYERGLLGDAHDFNKKRAKEAMERRISPIIIDNTNTQSWEMRPYVSMAVQHGYHVEFMEPETSWKFKPRELAKKKKVPTATLR